MKRGGFTFLELLIALTLFTVGMLSVLQIFPANRRLLNQTTLSTQAVFLAQEQLETVRTVAYEDISTGTYLARAAVTSDTASPFAGFEREVTVAYLDANRAVSGTDIGLKKITVTIYWPDRTLSRSYSASTYAYR